jgi:hypothetical protein
MQSTEANHVTTLGNKVVPRDRTRTSHTWKPLPSSTCGFSYTLRKINCDFCTCHKINSRLSKTTDLPPVVTPFRPLKPYVRHGSCPLFRNETLHNSPISHSSRTNWLKRAITSTGKSNKFELSQYWPLCDCLKLFLEMAALLPNHGHVECTEFGLPLMPRC